MWAIGCILAISKRYEILLVDDSDIDVRLMGLALPEAKVEIL